MGSGDVLLEQICAHLGVADEGFDEDDVASFTVTPCGDVSFRLFVHSQPEQNRLFLYTELPFAVTSAYEKPYKACLDYNFQSALSKGPMLGLRDDNECLVLMDQLSFAASADSVGRHIETLFLQTIDFYPQSGTGDEELTGLEEMQMGLVRI